MKKWHILMFCLLFHTILNINKIENFQEVTFYEGITEFQYKFTEPNLKEEKDVYFFFRFSNDFFIYLRIRGEDNKEKEIKVNNYYGYNYYKVSNSESQIYNFSINSRAMSHPQTMFFIDNSKEIYINLNLFLRFRFNSDKIEDTRPLSLIINIDTVEEKKIVLFHKDSKIESMVELCEINENN